MHQVEILHEKHPDIPSYELFLQKKFSNLKNNRNAINCHIIVKSNNHWVAGASLVHLKFLENDPDVTDLWDVKTIANCSRILRLWSLSSSALPLLLRAIETQIPAGNFIYGILSVSQKFALENSGSFQTKMNIIKPRYQICDTKFIDENYETSQGKRLIQIYKQFNAEFLGPVAASPADQTVRALMGVAMNEKSKPLFWKCYEADI